MHAAIHQPAAPRAAAEPVAPTPAPSRTGGGFQQLLEQHAAAERRRSAEAAGHAATPAAKPARQPVATSHPNARAASPRPAQQAAGTPVARSAAPGPASGAGQVRTGARPADAAGRGAATADTPDPATADGETAGSEPALLPLLAIYEVPVAGVALANPARPAPSELSRDEAASADDAGADTADVADGSDDATEAEARTTDGGLLSPDGLAGAAATVPGTASPAIETGSGITSSGVIDQPPAAKSSTPPAQASAPVEPPAIQISAAIANSAGNSGDRHFTLQLRPENLGRVEVHVAIGADGRTEATFTAQHPETLSLLKHDAPQLLASLQQSGVSVQHDALSFTLADHGTGSAFSDGAGRDAPGRGQAGPAVAEAAAAAPSSRPALNRLYDLHA